MPSSTPVSKGPKPKAKEASPAPRWEFPVLLPTLTGIFWAGFFLISWLVVDPSLRIHASSVHFYAHSEFWRQAISKPGGVLEYTAAWAGLADWSPAFGAALITLLALALSLLTRELARKVDSPSASWFSLVAPFLVLLQQMDYDARPVQAAVGLLLVLGGSWIYGQLLRKPIILQLALFSCLILVIHWLTGIGAALFTAWSLVLAAKERKWLMAGLLVVLAGILPFLGVQSLYPTAPAKAWFTLMWLEPHPWLLSAWFAIPLGSLVLRYIPVIGRLAGSRLGSKPSVLLSLRILWLGLILLLPLAFLNRDHRAWLVMDQAAQRHQWDKVLQQAGRLPLRKDALPIMVAWLQANRALYHEDRLLEDLFLVPQKKGSPILPNPGVGFAIGTAMSDVLLELGHVNYAEHWAHETLELLGDKPEILLRLALINQLHQRTNAARVFLACLSRNPAWRPTAQQRLNALRTDPLGTNDLELTRIRSCMPRSDVASSYLDTETLLDLLLQANPQNRMAFEYLMAHYLLSMQSQEILKRLKDFQGKNYSRLPRLIQEAVLFQQTLEGSQNVDLAGFQIAPETQRDYNDFIATVKSYTDGLTSARGDLEKRFSRTFWFYCVFGQNASAASSTLTSPAMQ